MSKLAYRLAFLPRPRVLKSTTLATAHAPSGGITIAGKKFKGGEFVPESRLAQATDEQKAKLEMRPDLFDAEPEPIESAKPHPAEQILSGVIDKVKAAHDFPKTLGEKLDLSGKKDNTSLVEERKPEEKKMGATKLSDAQERTFRHNIEKVMRLGKPHPAPDRPAEIGVESTPFGGDQMKFWTDGPDAIIGQTSGRKWVDDGISWVTETSRYEYPGIAQQMLDIIKRADATMAAQKEPMVKCRCGHTIPKSMVMSASFGSSCPECYDRMSDSNS